MSDHERGDGNGRGLTPRVSWTAVITVLVIVAGFLITLSTGLISVGTNTAQIAINTRVLADMREELAGIEARGTPRLQDLEKRVARHDEMMAGLPVVDARTQGQIESVQKNVARLDAALSEHVAEDMRRDAARIRELETELRMERAKQGQR